MNGTAPQRAASRGMCEAVASMPTPQAAATMPMVSLSWPMRSSASGTSGMAVPACRPIAAQAAKTGSSVRQGPTALAAWLVGLASEIRSRQRSTASRNIRFAR